MKKAGKANERRRDYENNERDFQSAQSEWEKTGNDGAWKRMFSLIQLAVFNSVNNRLEGTLDTEEITQRSLDVTMDIMERMRRRKSEGKPWKIKRLSSFVHLPSLSVYDEKIKFADSLLGEDAYTQDDGSIAETPEADMCDGIIRLHGGSGIISDACGAFSRNALHEISAGIASRLSMVLCEGVLISGHEIDLGTSGAQNEKNLKSALVDMQIALNTLRLEMGFDGSELDRVMNARKRKWRKIYSVKHSGKNSG